jgi:hypothetical protein
MSDRGIQTQPKIAQIASEMLAGSISYIAGARQISRLRFDAGIGNDPSVLPFVGVDSETDALPIEAEIRKLWSVEALEKLQPEIDNAEKWARETLKPYCQPLIDRRWGPYGGT